MQRHGSLDPRPAHQLAGCVVGVTGGTGFVGRHLVRRLLAHEATVRMLVRPGRAELAESEPAGGVLHRVCGDLADVTALADLARGCRVVFHAAATASVPDSLADPLGCLETNTMGTARVSEACRRAAVRRVVFLSTWAASADARSGAAISPYAASKVAAEAAVQSYRASFDLPAVIVRLSNVYGPGQGRHALIPYLLRAILAGEPVRLSAPGIERDFVFVSDCVTALLRIGTAPEPVDSTVDLGSGELLSVERVAEVIGEQFGVAVSLRYDQSAGPLARPYRADVGPLLRAIGDWRHTSLSAGIRAMIGALSPR